MYVEASLADRSMFCIICVHRCKKLSPFISKEMVEAYGDSKDGCWKILNAHLILLHSLAASRGNC